MEEEVMEEVSLFEEDGQPKEHHTPEAVEAAPEMDEAPAFEVPDKFKDKSMEDVIQSYVNLEKEYGNKTNEVGELRKWADTLLQAQTSQQPQHPLQAQVEDINDVGFEDFVDDPKTAVNKALESNPTIRKIEEQMAQQKLQSSRAQLLEAHPDADEIVATPEFNRWMMESPGRAQILQQAHVTNNVAVASDMLNLYKATVQATNEEAVTERNAKAKGDLKKANVETGGSPSSSKKIYKRSELIELKITNPQRYEAMKDEIHKAYAEKRVR